MAQPALVYIRLCHLMTRSTYNYVFSSNFKIYLFLTTNEINLFSNIEGSFFTFCFAPCVPSLYRWFTQIFISSRVLCRLRCRLFELVAPLLESFLLCCCPFSPTPSSSFHQRTAALLLSFPFIDPHTCFLMFL
jgi:hypothetical protein